MFVVAVLYDIFCIVLFQGVESGSFVVQCNATDADTAANAHVTYRLVQGLVNKFSINNVTGVISTSGTFDRETDPKEYTVWIQLFYVYAFFYSCICQTSSSHKKVDQEFSFCYFTLTFIK